MFLTKFAKKVYVSVIHNEGIMDANKVAQEKALKNEKMEFIWNTIVDSFEGDERLNRIVLKDLKTGELIDVDVDGCFLFIGYVPNTEVFKGTITMNSKGYIPTNENMETNLDGVYAAGDVRDKFLRQVATAVGDGAIAGVMAEKYVEESDYFQKEIMESPDPVLIYIYNATEAVDREYLTRIEAFVKEMPMKVKLSRMDIYKSDKMSCRFGCNKTPCIVLIQNGKLIDIEYDLDNLYSILNSIVKN
jgi:thioredoxin reductase (NADPH)